MEEKIDRGHTTSLYLKKKKKKKNYCGKMENAACVCVAIR